MGRYYNLSKTEPKEVLKEIVREIRELQNVKSIKIVRQNTCLQIETEDNEYSQVMTKVVNICSRVGNGLAISFAGFVR